MPLLTGLLLSLLLTIHLLPNRLSMKIGEIANRDIVAPRTIRYEDTEATRRLRDDARLNVAKRYSAVPDAVPLALDALTLALTDPDGNDTHRLPADVRSNSLLIGTRVVREAMERPLRDDTDDLSQAHQLLRQSPLLAEIADPSVRNIVTQAVVHALRPNMRYDAEGTERIRQDTIAAVRPQIRRLTSGAVVIRAGERVQQPHIDALTALGMLNAKIDPLSVVVIVSLVALLILLVGAYLALFDRALYDDTARLTLLAILTVISVVGIKIGSTLLGLPFSGVHFGYLAMMCVASAGMVISLMLSPSVATLVVALLAVVSGLVLNNELRFTLLTLSSALAGIVGVATLKHRGDLIRAAGILCGANALLIAVVGQLEGDQPLEMLSGMIWGVIAGLFAIVLFWLGVAVFEKPFGITTNPRLLELSDPATPILQEFRMKVPGTYAHSLMVGNLAHAAADAIGADSLLVRVAAYYHDLGKMNRPEFFIENQANAENVHDRIAPSLSAIVLSMHVKEGLLLAESVGLPPRVRDVISQHHGTSLMRYFYHRAVEGGSTPGPELESRFRYPGPKPQTKEAAILMLADTIEAASRSLERPTPLRIAEFVARLIEDKRADGQLDDSPLTLHDLKTIERVFVRTLSATLHARIEYPAATSLESDRGTDRPVETAPSAAPPLVTGAGRGAKPARRSRST